MMSNVQVKPLEWDRYGEVLGYGCKYMVYEAGFVVCLRCVLVPAPAVPDDVATWRQCADGFAKSNQTLRCDLTEAQRTIEAQAAELARMRQEAARIADDYHPERGQEALALSEMRDAIAALTHPTGGSND